MRSLESLTPADYIGIIRRRIWYFLLTAALVSAVAVIVVARMQKIFKSETRIVLNGRVVPVGIIGSLAGITPNDKVESVKQLLQTRTFLSKIVTEFQFAKPEDVPRFESALASVKANIEITSLNSTAFLLGYYAPEPALAQQVTRRLAEAVIQTTDNKKVTITRVSGDFLEEQMRQATNELTEKDAAVDEFKRQHFPGLVPGDDTAEGVRALRSEMAILDTRLQTAVRDRHNLDLRLMDQQRPLPVTRPLAPTRPAAPAPPAAVAPAAAAPAAVDLGMPPQPTPVLPTPAANPARTAPPKVVPAPPRQPTPLENTLAAKKQLLTEYEREYTPKNKRVVDLKQEIEALEERVQQARKEEAAQEAVKKELERKEAEKQRAAEAEKLRRAETERLRLAEAERLRLAEAERLRLAEAERLRTAEAERLRTAEAERLRTAEVERSQTAGTALTNDPDPIEAYDAKLRARNEADIRARMQELDGEITQAERQKKALLDRLSLAQSYLRPGGDLAKQMTDLVRLKEAAAQAYQSLLARYLNAKIMAQVDGNSDSETFEVIDPAYLPQIAVKPNRRLLAAAGCLAGLLAGFAAAFGRELLDPSVHTEADALAILKLPILAGVPMLAGAKNRKQLVERHGVTPVRPGTSPGMFSLDGADEKIRDVLFNPFSIAGENYRFMNTKLLLMQKERGVKSVLITSAIPGEGKTFSACCLAGILARESGSRVLLIDADLRTGSASQAMGLSADLVGLHQMLRRPNSSKDRGARISDSGLAAGPPDLDQVVVRCSDINLDFLPAGTNDENRSQLSSTPELERLLRQAEQNYDWVVVDSPPVLAVADANLLAPLCDGTVLVVGSGRTNSALIKEAIDKIGLQRICGLLVNRLRAGNHRSYHTYYKRLPAKQSTVGSGDRSR